MFLENKWFYTPYPESDHNASVVQPTAWSAVSSLTGSGDVPPPSNAKAKNQWNYTSTPTICLWHGLELYLYSIMPVYINKSISWKACLLLSCT